MLSEGETSKTIATALGLTEDKVFQIRAILFAKTGARNAANLVKIAITEKLI